MNDIDIRQDIIDELDFAPGIDPANVGVTVDDGVVTLSGHVTTYGQKTLAEDLTRHVKGVRGLVSKIEVSFFGQKANTDEDIAKRALNMINWNSFVPDDAVQVQVHQGWVTLSGQLEWQFQRQEAEEAVRNLAGVKGVTNKIELTTKASATDIKQRIEGALKRAAEVEAAAIRVNVLDNGRVKLEGKVHDFSERSAAERAAWSAAGVRSVDDQLMVV